MCFVVVADGWAGAVFIPEGVGWVPEDNRLRLHFPPEHALGAGQRSIRFIAVDKGGRYAHLDRNLTVVNPEESAVVTELESLGTRLLSADMTEDEKNLDNRLVNFLGTLFNWSQTSPQQMEQASTALTPLLPSGHRLQKNVQSIHILMSEASAYEVPYSGNLFPFVNLPKTANLATTIRGLSPSGETNEVILFADDYISSINTRIGTILGMFDAYLQAADAERKGQDPIQKMLNYCHDVTCDSGFFKRHFCTCITVPGFISGVIGGAIGGLIGLFAGGPVGAAIGGVAGTLSLCAIPVIVCYEDQINEALGTMAKYGVNNLPWIPI